MIIKYLSTELIFIYVFVLASNLSFKRNIIAADYVLFSISVINLLTNIYAVTIGGQKNIFSIILLVIACIIFVFSIIILLRHKSTTIENISLKKDEYVLVVEESHTTNGGAIMRPIMIFSGGIIEFALVPYSNIDATFVCRKIEEGRYFCHAYVDESCQITYKRLLNITSKFILFFGVTLANYLYYLKEVNVELFSHERLLSGVVLTVVATVLLKLFRNNSNIIAYVMRGLAVILYFLVVLSFIKYGLGM
ncbi:hypothetical protein SAMN02910298_01944 [Pseudobutyrivibrio sp. YE44]|uniref:hypothetical protein n=1 Tax=Pseudobutyrivibrio sp. YE44 TaxID=1520802 RepID=UPI000882E8E5|nr:hypothetical protein [Pseudobutyrivibrio sp. YE44]SDB39917.1 hypothetical protein SAMN02910298_01944 [Pseudobutyrivibrio sp. YE44]